MEILAADRSHYAGIVKLITSREELFQFFPCGSYPVDENQLIRLAQRRRDLTVVTERGEVVGFANIYGVFPGKRSFIGNLLVSKHYRGQGIGKRLVQHMMDLAFDKYGDEVHLSVFGFNARALLLYASLGFKPYDVEQRITPNGERVALIHMRVRKA